MKTYNVESIGMEVSLVGGLRGAELLQHGLNEHGEFPIEGLRIE